MKLYLATLALSVQEWVRNILGVNEDVAMVRQDLTNIVKMFEDRDNAINTISSDVYAILAALSHASSIQSLDAATAARLTNPNAAEPNSLSSLLTSILISTRVGQSQLQVNGEITPSVVDALQKRGFKVENIDGSNSNSATFILWI